MADFVGCNVANYTKGRQGYTIQGIVIHSIVGSLDSCIRTFQNPTRQASAHYGVGWDGRVVQFVDDGDTAWHADRWAPDSEHPLANLNTIGIEHDDQGQPDSVRPDLLYEASAHLVAALCQKHNIPCDRDHIRKHSEVASHATSCPAALDIDRIINHARELLAPPAVTSAYTGVVTPGSGDVNVRNMPNLTGQVISHYPAGAILHLEAQTNGDSVLSNPTWYKLQGEQAYVWSGRIQVQAQSAPETPTQTTTSNTPVEEKPVIVTDDHTLIDIGGSYGTQELQAIRSLLADKEKDLVNTSNQLAQKSSLLDKIAHLFGLS